MKGFIFIIFAVLLWASDGLFRYPLLSGGLSAETVVFYEHLLLIAIFLPLLLLNLQAKSKKRNSSTTPSLFTRPSHLFYFAVIGVGGAAVATLSYTRAFYLINPSLVILLQKLQPLIAVLLARLWLKEPLSSKFIFWGLLCLAGALLISFHDVQVVWEQLHSSSLPQLLQDKSIHGYLYTLVAVVCWGTATVFGKKLTLLGYKAGQIMGGRYLMAILALTPLMVMGGHSFDISSQQLLQISLMAILAGLLGTYFYYRGLSVVSARVCTLGELFYPLGAVLLNWIFLDLTVHPLQMIGGAILLLSATMVQIKRY